MLYDLLNYQAVSVRVITNYNLWMLLHKTGSFQNPREATSRSRKFIFSLVNVSVGRLVCGLYGTSWPNETRYRPEIQSPHSPIPYLKIGFRYFEQTTLRRASLEKLSCHVNFSHISSIALLFLQFQPKIVRNVKILATFSSFGIRANFFSNIYILTCQDVTCL